MKPFELSESARSAIMDVLTENTFQKQKEMFLSMGIGKHTGSRSGKPFTVAPFDCDRPLSDRQTITESTQTDWLAGFEFPEHTAQENSKHVDLLTNDELHATNRYIVGGLYGRQQTGSRSLTQHLHQAHKDGVPPLRNFKQHSLDGDASPYIRIDHLDSAVTKSVLHPDTVTYTGMHHDPRTFHATDGEIEFKQFLSATANKFAAVDYAAHGNDGGHILKIVHFENSRGLYVGNDTRVTPFEHHELILPRGMKVRLLPISRPAKLFGRDVMLHTAHRMPLFEQHPSEYKYRD